MSEFVYPIIEKCYYTPIRDALCLRFSGRLNWQAALSSSELPIHVQSTIRKVVINSRLSRLEQAAVCDELIAHFADGQQAGASYKNLLKDFGDLDVVATLIGRSKKRNRSMFFKIGRAASYGALGLLATYVGMAIYFFLGHPEPSIDFVQDFNVVALDEKEENKAWSIYREAWINHDFIRADLEEIYYVSEDDDSFTRRILKPTDAGWPIAVEYLQNRPDLLAAFRDAAKKPALGLELKMDYQDYGARDLMALFPHAVDENGELLKELAESVPSSESQYGSIEGSVIGLLLPHVQSFRQIARILVVDTRLAVEENDPARAMENIETIFGTARHAGEPPILVCSLVSFAVYDIGFDLIEELSTEQPNFLSDDQLNEIQQLVAQLPIREQVKLDGERAMMYDILQRLYTDDGNGNGRMTIEGVKALPFLTSMTGGSAGSDSTYARIAETVMAPASVFAFASRKQMKEKFDEFLEDSEFALDQPIAEYELDLDSKLKQLSSRNRFKYAILELIFPAVEQVRVALERRLARRDAVELAIAANRFRLANGDWPTIADQLSPKYIKKIPADPLTGEPVRFAIGDGQFKIYSVGNNLSDDGGQSMTESGTEHQVKVFLFESAKSRPFDGDWILWPNKSSQF